MRISRIRLGLAAGMTLTGLFAAVPRAAPAAAAGSGTGGLSASSFVQTWSQGPFKSDHGNPIAEGSPVVANLDGGGPAAIVGDRTGYLYAYHLSDGSPVAGWPVYDGGAPIDSTPSVAPVGPGGRDEVFVGEGNAANPYVGGYTAYSAGGTQLWHTQVQDPPSDSAPNTGVQASLTVASMQGATGVYAGSLDQEGYALSTATGAALTGWPFFDADSVFSTAAAADLYGTGRTDLVVGGASTAGLALGQNYPQGGHLRILSSTGALICHYDTTQEVDSSPAVGAFLPGAATGIVVGTGTYWPGASDTDVLDAFDTSCGLRWSDHLEGNTTSSPALAQVLGDGGLQVVEGTDDGTSGSVYVINGADGSVIWQRSVGRVIGSVVTADLTGQGYQDLLVPTTYGLVVLDGRSGDQVASLSMGGYQNSPLVTDDPNGTIGITVAGYQGQNDGLIYHYEIPGSDGAEAVGAGSWPMFHHDPQLSGVSPEPLSPVAPCAVPAAALHGYRLVASDGGVFSFGAPFCGSTGGIRLAEPVVGAAVAAGTGGYWMVASDGGVFSFGAAGFYGSTGAVHLAKPVIGMAATADGRGYWLVASDGGVFTFGDARFYGSASGAKLDSPIVAAAATPDGRGYWMTTAKGSVYCFGDASDFGGTGSVKLAHPIVGMAADPATGGYWLVASDGGVFSFSAPFYGSTGAVRLAAPVVGLTPTGDGYGYWMVASDGGVFSFGDATFDGSTGAIRLNRPVLAMAGFSG